MRIPAPLQRGLEEQCVCRLYHSKLTGDFRSKKNPEILTLTFFLAFQIVQNSAGFYLKTCDPKGKHPISVLAKSPLKMGVVSGGGAGSQRGWSWCHGTGGCMRAAKATTWGRMQEIQTYIHAIHQTPPSLLTMRKKKLKGESV